MANENIKGYKGFDEKLQCRGFQYEIGKTHTMDGYVEICERGFHAIPEDESPMNVFGYYAPTDENGHINRFCEVEASGKIVKKDEKIAASKLKVVAEIGIIGIAKAHVEWVLSRVKKDGKKSAHKDEDNSIATNTGCQSAATNTGCQSAATNTGRQSAATNTGYKSAATNTGCQSAATNTGYKSAATNTGDYSAATNTGCQSAAEVSGKGSVAIVTGKESKARGALGCWLVLTERGEWDGETYPIIEVRAVKVDGDAVKPNVWYELSGGMVVEA